MSNCGPVWLCTNLPLRRYLTKVWASKTKPLCGFSRYFATTFPLTRNTNMKKKIYLIILLALASASFAWSQSLERQSGEMLVQLRPEASPATVLNQLKLAVPGAKALIWKDIVAPDWQMYLLGFDEAGTDATALLAAARRQPDILAAQWNHRTLERSTQPNDPDWWQQDDMTLIGMPEAWDVTYGGLTLAGDTIVVAVLEKGALLDHPDLAPNAWFNRGEIPDNGLDDDGNGYIDDYKGWNPRTKDDDPGNIGFHGTAVNGVIGARGNNNLGVTGVNWHVKLMNLGNVEIESEIVAAYNYVATMRKRYNASNGSQGAFVVATNASFGLDFEKGIDHPLWCAVYDSLGKVGVLSVGATTNQNTNVDIQGDMPSTCPSEYLLIVTNMDKFDKKMPNTGYGPIHVDLGAPGQGTHTTWSQGTTPSYGAFHGTSAATPHVTGAIGLLYSLQCADLTVDALTQPAACARRIRDVILENVSPNETLQNITTTDGRLDVARSVKFVQDICGGAASGPLDILWLRPNPVLNELRIRYQTPTYSPYTVRVFNILGQQLYEEVLTPSPFSENIWEYNTYSLPLGVYVVAFGRKDAWRAVKFVKN